MKRPLPRKQVIRLVVIFLGVYVLSLLIWLPVKKHYGYAMTLVSSKLVAGLKDAKLEEITREKDMVQATFSPLGTRSDMLVDITIKTSSYTFNTPLTAGILAALYPFIMRRRRAYAEAVVMLLTVHFLYVFFLEAKELTDVFTAQGVEAKNNLALAIYQFAWSFTDNMAIRFEPFLIGFYVFLRFGGKKG
jgi:uncharacterized membrane protein (Fun14 family)